MLNNGHSGHYYYSQDTTFNICTITATESNSNPSVVIFVSQAFASVVCYRSSILSGSKTASWGHLIGMIVIIRDQIFFLYYALIYTVPFPMLQNVHILNGFARMYRDSSVVMCAISIMQYMQSEYMSCISDM